MSDKEEPMTEEPVVDEPTIDDPTYEDDSYDEPPMDDSYDEPPMDDSYDEPPMDDSYEEPPMDEYHEDPPMDDPTEYYEDPPMDDPTEYYEDPPMDDPKEYYEDPPMDDSYEDPPMDDSYEDPPMDDSSGYEDETIITYFAGNDEQDYSTFEEAEQVVRNNLEHIFSDFSNLLQVKQVHVKEDGSFVILTAKFTHSALSNLEDGNYLAYSMYSGNGEQIHCQNAQDLIDLIELNKQVLRNSMGFVRVETMTIHDETLDEGFTQPKMEIVPGEPYVGELINPLGSDYVGNGVGPHLTKAFQYDKMPLEF